jgi:CheY-like chemotaxis protein
VAKIKILIVDDSSYNLFVMGELMQQIKFAPEEKKALHVETALNGQLAVDKVKE